MSDIAVYGVGLVCASACAPIDATTAEIENTVNSLHPTGISSRWQISSDTEFADGHPMPCPCEQSDGRQHWLLNC